MRLIWCYCVVIWQKRRVIWAWYIGRRLKLFLAMQFFSIVGLIWPDFLLEKLKEPLLRPVLDNGGKDGVPKQASPGLPQEPQA